MLPRFFCAEALDPGASLDLPDEVAHHAVRVLRMQEGDRLRLFDGRGGEWTVRLTRLKPRPHVLLEEFDPRDAEPPLAVKLVQCLPAGDKMDWVIQKCIELGVASVQPVAARRSVIRLDGEKAARRALHWQGVAVAACEQCGRNRVPTVEALLDLPQYLAFPAQDNELRLVLAPGAERRLRDIPAPAAKVTLLVGPEGGLEEGEMKAAQQAGFVPLGLGPRVLRTETAGPSALAAIMSLWGDW